MEIILIMKKANFIQNQNTESTERQGLDSFNL